MDYIVSPVQPRATMAVEKPKSDTAYFIGQVGFEKLQYSRYVSWNDKHWTSEFQGIFAGIEPNDVVIYQTPTYAGTEVEDYAVEAAHEKGAKVVGLVHDVEYLRYPEDYDKERELNFLKTFDGLIVGSKRIHDALRADGITTPMVESGPWGYIQPFEYARPKFSKTIHYAGNLITWKAGFLSKVPEGLDLQVYGSNGEDEKPDYPPTDSVTLRGPKTQQELALLLTNGFGLIWDADQNLKFSEYTRMALSHKFSLYLSLGLPLIANRDTAIGEYIEKHGLGFVIDGISELQPLMDEIDESKYNQVVDRVAIMSDLVRRGRHIQSAALEISLKVRDADVF